MNETMITLVGNLTADPELRFTPTGKAVANFTVATTPRRREGETWVDGTTTFWTCELWGQLAEHAAETLTKGQRTILVGIIRTDTWTDNEGTERRTLRVVVDDIGPSLKFTTPPAKQTERHGPTHVVRNEPAF
jgi:single-strand DNA-binding protein